MRLFFGSLIFLWILQSAEGGSLPFEGLDDLRGPYEGTGASGEAFHVQPLGDAGKWRICAYWSSARTESSPWLGYGWSIPALESRFVQLDERRWAFHQPDGYVRIFVRTGNKVGGVLHLSGGPAWTAECKGESIRVTADPKDGGPVSRFIFRRGRLVRMSCEEGDFEIKYTGRKADRILSNGRTLLEAVQKKAPEEGVVFKFNGGRSQVVAISLPATVFVAHGDSRTAASTTRRSSRPAGRAGRGIRARGRSSRTATGPTRLACQNTKAMVSFSNGGVVLILPQNRTVIAGRRGYAFRCLQMERAVRARSSPRDLLRTDGCAG